MPIHQFKNQSAITNGVVDLICASAGEIGIILVCGPRCSGKTTILSESRSRLEEENRYTVSPRQSILRPSKLTAREILCREPDVVFIDSVDERAWKANALWISSLVTAGNGRLVVVASDLHGPEMIKALNPDLSRRMLAMFALRQLEAWHA